MRVYHYKSPYILVLSIVLGVLCAAALVQAGLVAATGGALGALPFVLLAALFGYLCVHEAKVYRNEKVVLENNHLKYYSMHGHLELDQPIYRIEGAYTTKGLVEVLTIRFRDAKTMSVYALMSNYDQMKSTAFELADQAAARPEIAELGSGPIIR